MEEFFNRLIEASKEGMSGDEFSKLKMKLCREFHIKRMPTNIEILLRTPEKLVPKLKGLMTKPTRTLSGVAVVAVMTKPHKCPHGKCSCCPGGVDSNFGDVPQSYTGAEPATRRAIRNNYDPYLQVMNRLEQYIVTGHTPEKVELIIMGGTFPSLPKDYRNNFIANCFSAMNDFSKMFFRGGKLNIKKFKDFFELPGELEDDKRKKSILAKLKILKKNNSLEKEHLRNEKSHIKCVSLVIETRPDFAKLIHANEMLRVGATKVELGVQSVFDEALDFLERGHSVEDSVNASAILRDLGFKITYHMMPGLVSKSKDLKGLNMLFSDDRFKPDMLKIYPCMILKGTKLYDLWKKGKYKPLSTTEAIKMIAEFKKEIPEYVRINRVQRDIPTSMTEAGVDRTNLRQYIGNYMREKGWECRCIRCREIGRRESKEAVEIRIMNYKASEGDEFFISAETGGSILGFCRLRFAPRILRSEINSAIIRELHVYGQATGIGKEGSVQHKGWGKKLLAEAERISKENGKRKIVVISGVGVRGYYRKLGYRKEGVYMVKRFE